MRSPTLGVAAILAVSLCASPGSAPGWPSCYGLDILKPSFNHLSAAFMRMDRMNGMWVEPRPNRGG